MKVRKISDKTCVGRSGNFNTHGLGEMIVVFPEGDMSSEYLREYEAYMETSDEWIPILDALLNNNLITDNLNTSFFEPKTEEDRERGYTL